MAPKIAIIGAGPGGCMLARLLHQSNAHIPVTIFEAEASVNYRSQGGTLDLRSSTGLAAIKEAGLWDEFQKYARYDGESLLVTDKNLVTWLRRSPRKNASDGKTPLQEAPEIDRKDLRKMLMESLPEGAVRWGFKLSKVEQSPAGIELHFANGEVVGGFDLIVGCDGAFSKTRSFLSPEKPFYVGLGGWALGIPDAVHTAPEVYKLVNRGSVFAYSDGKSLAIQQLSDESLHVSSYGSYPEDYTQSCGFDAQDLGAAKSALKQALHEWSPQLLDAVDKTQGAVAWRNLYQLPVGFTWPHRPGITLLGDAAHLMTPFSGIGVNTAFYDAMLLAQSITSHTVWELEVKDANDARTKEQLQADLDERIVEYENKMFEQAHKAQRHTAGSMNDMLLTPGAPRTTIESWILRHTKDDIPAWLYPIVSTVVYVGYWVYKWFV
ncbi:FAD/NAD(P)-binding domain-containing protein [Cucurbitaria berberidis CBS 394.84]|uniref:FAD/NAD(P)-binding domain-containing protein n=1 Tax=Cucurbitaria berberidis CBS 394.84 TaxID=1168544 RepID=A0A9P4GFG9_9PLEO|nr:FAD/NAD(P)-binding domain-containing protein [Cucurbitaria berberidis CBS 394.84]KAF1844301.1 FAD/NAD(P)-binding domain-containing protein [Cucurbitaria berberidis CBS 394.84]